MKINGGRNMNKIMKVTVISLLMIIMVSIAASIMNYSFAEGFDFKGELATISDTTGNSEANEAARSLVGSLAVITRIIGMGVAVIMLIVLAMKYMMAAPGDKADIKKHATVYVVGAVILFAVTGILEIIAQFASGIGGTSGAGE